MIEVNIRNRFNDEIIYAAQIDSRYKDEPRSIRLRAAILTALEEGRRRDFSEADLRGADFRYIDFSIFGEVTFDRADLTGADLTKADLSCTKGVVDLSSLGWSACGWWLDETPMVSVGPHTQKMADARYDFPYDKNLVAALDRFGEIIAAQKGAG